MRDVGVLNDSALHIVHPTQIQEVVCVMTYFYAPCLMKLAKFFLNKSLTNLTHMTELFLLGEKKKRKLFEEALQFYLKSGQGDSFQFDFFFLFLSKIFWQLVLLPVGNSYLFFSFFFFFLHPRNLYHQFLKQSMCSPVYSLQTN